MWSPKGLKRLCHASFPFPRHFLTELVQKPQKYCGWWLLTQFLLARSLTSSLELILWHWHRCVSWSMRLFETLWQIIDGLSTWLIVVCWQILILSCIVAVDIMSLLFLSFHAMPHRSFHRYR